MNFLAGLEGFLMRRHLFCLGTKVQQLRSAL